MKGKPKIFVMKLLSFRKGNNDKNGLFLEEKKKNLKEIVLKVNNHEEAWRLFKNSLLETQEKCLPQPKMSRHLKINIKCLNGKGKKAVQKKERMRQVIFLGRKRIFQEEEWESYKCDRSNLHKIKQIKTA